MVSDEFIRKAVQAKKSYEDLPGRIRNTLTLADWKNKVKEHCIDCGYGWSDSMASTSCGEQEYYEDLLAFYKSHERVFPYHLAHYVCRVLRVSPFQYYSDIITNSLKNEKAYDKIPNFTAADALRLLGVGRNEYISILDSLRGKKLLWRVNKNIAKERLPVEPVAVHFEPWWKIGVVNVTEVEFRLLNKKELELLQGACQGSGLEIRRADIDTFRSLYNRGLLYVRIPIKENNRFTIPPLEGFVSNRNAATESVDPMEALLYSVFVANSENVGIGHLARVLNVDARDVRAAMSFGCRLGFASRIEEEDSQDDGASYESFPFHHEGDEGKANREAEKTAEPASSGNGQAVALVVDAEVTSYLMMGALSPGVKRHAVTLFEGGKVAGEEAIADLIAELTASLTSGIELEGDMIRLTNYASALATSLKCIKDASGGRSAELLRIESLSELAPGAIQRVLSHSYKIVLPVALLPGGPLPLISKEDSLVSFGPTAGLASPWGLLALYENVSQGPVSIVFLRGQRVRQLPLPIAKFTTLSLRIWGPITQAPVIVSQPFLLTTLNELLQSSPVLVQPICRTIVDENGKVDEECLVDVPLPLYHQEERGPKRAIGFHKGSGKETSITIPYNLEESLASLGLTHTLGFLRMMHVKYLGDAIQDIWTPVELHVGLPLHNIGLCEAVCSLATTGQLLDSEHEKLQVASHAAQKLALADLVGKYGGKWGLQKADSSESVAMPSTNFMFDGDYLILAEFPECLQGLDMTLGSCMRVIRAPNPAEQVQAD